MEATRKRTIKSGEEFNHLFLKAEGNSSTIQKNANVTHTVAFIPKVVSETLDQTKKLSKILKGGLASGNMFQYLALCIPPHSVQERQGRSRTSTKSQGCVG